MRNNKGQVQNLPAYVISFVLIGLVVAVSLVVLSRMEDALYVDTAVTLENVTNNTAFANTPVRSLESLTTNASVVLTEGTNYTLDGNKVVVHTPVSSWYVANYTYGATTAGSTALANTQTSVSPITTDYLPIIVIIVIVGVVLAIIVGAFSFYKGRQ